MPRPNSSAASTDARADIYALGALLLATFRGKPPDIGNNPMEVVQRKALPLDTEGVPEPLKSLIDRMTVPDREHRLQSAAEVLATIRHGGAADPAVSDADRTVIVPHRTTPPQPGTAAAPPTDAPPTAAPSTAAASTAAPPKRASPPPASRSAPPPTPAPAPAPAARRSRAPLIAVLVTVLLAALGAGGYVSGAFDTLLGPKFPVADPYTLVMEHRADGTTRAVGNVPSPEIRDAVTKAIAAAGGQATLTLATGDIAPSWGDGMLALLREVGTLPEWRVAASGNQVRVTGMTLDPALQQHLTALLQPDKMPEGLTGSGEISLGPQFVTAAMLTPVLDKFADCGAIRLADPPATGYPHKAAISISGNFATMASRVDLADAIAAVAGDREVRMNGEVLNPTLCLIDAALPSAPPGGFDITFGFGSRPDPNPTGRYFVGENPVIDVTIPADVTSGFLFVSALDVSGNIFHMLPNLNREDNAIAALRGGRTGAVKVRVAFAQSEATDGKKLAFLVDASSLGKTRILVIHSETQIFDGLRPTTESATSFADALKARTGPVDSLDSRILTTVAKP